MEYTTVEDWIEGENGHQASVEDQQIVAVWFYENDITIPEDEDRRTSEVRDEVGDRLEHDVETALDNLSDIGVLDKEEPASRQFIRNERTNEAFFSPNAEDFSPSLYEELSRLIYDIHLREGQNERGPYPGGTHVPSIAPVANGGRPLETSSEGTHSGLRQFVASELDVPPAEVEDALVEPEDIVEQMVQFDDLIEAIKESDDVERGLGYDQVGWRNRANRWSLSTIAKGVMENESLTEWTGEN